MDVAKLKDLADLARLDPSPEELDHLAQDIPAILDYVAQLKDVTTEGEIGWHGHVLNQTSPDEHDAYDDPEALVQRAAQHRDRFVQVPQIMNTSDE